MIDILSHFDLNYDNKSIVRWNRESATKAALKYKTRTEFQKKCGGGYQYASRHNFLAEICTHMQPILKKVHKWNIESLKKASEKYNRRSDFMKNESGAYFYAWKHSLLDEVCGHMGKNNGKHKK